MKLEYNRSSGNFSGHVSRYDVREIFSSLQKRAAELSEQEQWGESVYIAEQMENLLPVVREAHDYSSTGYGDVTFTD